MADVNYTPSNTTGLVDQNITTSVDPRERPDTAAFNTDKLPRLSTNLQPLMNIPNWVIWKWGVNEKGEPTKVPYQARHPEQKASTADLKTWASNAEAYAAAKAHQFVGSGFVLTNTPISAFDIDDCRNPKTEEIHPWALDLIRKSNSYAEITPSRTGVRIIGLSTQNAFTIHRKFPVKDGVSCEIYRHATRYITMSGLTLEDRPLRKLDEVIDAVYAELLALNPRKKRDNKQAHIIDIDRLPVSERMRNLIQGIDAPEHQYPSRSERVMAVAVAMAGAGCSDEQIEAVMWHYPIGAHIRDQSDPEASLERTIAKAREMVRDPIIE